MPVGEGKCSETGVHYARRGHGPVLDIWTGQFNIVDGSVSEEGPFVGTFEGDAGGPDGVGVYIVAEPCGGASPELCNATIEAIARSFDAPRQALTASLLRALNAANEFVCRYHPGEAAPDFGVGVSVLAVRRGEGYVAQAGPALAYVRTAAGARLLESVGEGASRPLGSAGRVTPTFARLEVAAGDCALLLFSAADALVDRRRLAQFASLPPEQALPDIFTRCRDQRHFGTLYLSVIGERRLPPPPNPDPWSRRAADTHAYGAPVAEGGSTSAGNAAIVQETTRREGRNGHAGDLQDAVRTIVPRRTPLGTMAPTGLPVTRRQLTIAVVVAGLALLLLLVLPGLARQGQNEKVSQLLRGANEAIAAAEREPDIARRRALLERAQATIDEARALRTVAPSDLGGLEQRLAGQLVEINGVRELADLALVADLAAPGLAAPSATQVALGPAVYLLDASAGKVVAIPREGDPKPVTVFEEGRTPGPNRTGRARSMTWWAAEGNRPGALLVLDDKRLLYAVDARGDIRPIALGDTSGWRSDTAIAMGTSNLYVLDPGANQIWRYTLNAGGFPGGPEPLLNARAVVRDASGLSLAVGPVLTTPDGRILRVADGREQLLQPVAMDRPLLAPAAPLLNPADGLLYVADRGNQRIVKLRPDGAFAGQLTHHRLAGLQAIALDEAAGALYAIAGQSLVKATIPK